MTESTKRTIRILLIEDSEEDTFFLLRELGKANYRATYTRVQTVESVEAAVLKERWDLVLCDNSMPALTGQTALELVRQHQPTIPFIFLSGSDRAPEGTESSLVPFVQKGDRAALLSALERSLAGNGVRPPPPEPSPNLTRVASPTRLSTPASPKILMVDDRPENLEALDAVLSPLGCTLVRAQSGEEALERLLKEDVALILLDVQMPGMGGLETADLIHQRARSRSVPIIFLTAGSDDPQEIARGYDVGCVDYLTKPFIPNILKAKVSVFLELWRKTSILERQAAELRSANESLDAFTSSASHDLKVPLRAMEAYSRILYVEFEGKILDPAGTGYARRIGEAALRMKMLTEDLLAYARLGRFETPLVPLDVTDVVDGLLPDLQEEIEFRKGALRVDRPLGKALGHPLLLRQALANLITNALKFALPGQTPEVVIQAQARARGIRISVQDRGIGIGRPHQDRLFKPFVRLENAAAYPGTGLGLAIVKKAVERMDGKVGVESAVGKGSTFYIDLQPVPLHPHFE